MKKNCFRLAVKLHTAVLLALVSSCSEEIPADSVAPPQYCIYASLEQDSSTKTALFTNGDGIGKIYWKSQYNNFEQISVFSETNAYCFRSRTIQSDEWTQSITFSLVGNSFGNSVTFEPSNNIWGLYPYDSQATCDGQSINTSLPFIQQGQPYSFDRNDLFPMLAHGENEYLQFYNVGGGVVFSLARDDIKTVRFRGNNGESLAGGYNVTFVDGRPATTPTNGVQEITLNGSFMANTDYYIVCLPVYLSQGFTMSFETGKETGTFVYSSPVSIKRSCFSRKNNIDNYASFDTVENSVIQYVTNDCQAIGFDNGSSFNVSIISNTYNEDENIGEIVFDGKLETIGYSAFSGKKTLREIILPEGVRTIEDNAFDSCTALFSVQLPETVETIGDKCFNGCSMLKNITLPEGLKSLGSAFMKCSNLRSINIPESISMIKGGTFLNCSQLSKVVFAEGSCCKSLEVDEVGYPAYYTYCYGAFEGCTALSSITLPAGMETLGKHAFYNAGLKQIDLPASLKTIGPYAFEKTKLTEITIPSSVTSIESRAFGYCSQLKSAVVNASVPQLSTTFAGCTSLESASISEGIETMESTFSGCSSLKNVNIPQSVKTLDATFSGCTSLTTIDLPDGLITIGDSAFQNCPLTAVALPGQLKSIGKQAFYNSSIEDLTFPASVTTIGQGAFSYCSRLTTITIPSTIKTLEQEVFANCTGLERAEIESSIVMLNAFQKCTNLKVVTLGKKVGSLSGVSFSECPNIEKFVSSSTSFEVSKDGRSLVGYDGTLVACATGGLTYYVIPKNTDKYDIEYLGPGVFAYVNDNLTTIVLPPSILAFGTYSLAGASITDIYFTNNEPAQLSWSSATVESSIGTWMVGTSSPPITRNAILHVPEEALEDYKSAWSRLYNTYATYTTLPGFANYDGGTDGIQDYSEYDYNW